MVHHDDILLTRFVIFKALSFYPDSCYQDDTPAKQFAEILEKFSRSKEAGNE